MKKLCETIRSQAWNLEIPPLTIPSYIEENLKHDFFTWQREALENFLIYQEIEKKKPTEKPTHLLFNMATGTGKTLLMASTLLYYYAQGYRHFLFFVNQNNIVDKTENNFINSTHTKYLFKENIVIADKTVPMKNVETFSDNPQGIEIKFTTIQKLYNDIHLEKENETTLEDLQRRDLVMLADEAHHLNAYTKSKSGEQKEIFKRKLSSKKEVEKKGWEHTIIKLILHKNHGVFPNRNVLLEFTATIPNNRQVEEKYAEKIICEFGLKSFLREGYTKEINLISSTLDKKERILQALVFQWYRHCIALKYNVPNFKPVILFRSKTIESSKEDHRMFLDWVANLTSDDFNFLKDIANRIHKPQRETIIEMGSSRTSQVLQFIQDKKIKYAEIAAFIRNNFQEKNVVITNSKSNTSKAEKTTEEQERLLNSLEDKDNHIRAIFTVNRLTEGWDVLNLFDIVRLHEGQPILGNTVGTPDATTTEKQLIGRGVRYFPFAHEDKIPNKRKFDNDLGHELRLLEELYYYTYDEESRYISQLKNELRKDGYIRDDKTVVTFGLKKEFEQTDFFKKTKIWYNKQVENPKRRWNTLDTLEKTLATPYRVRTLELSEQEVDLEKSGNSSRLSLRAEPKRMIDLEFKDLENQIFRKAIHVKTKQEGAFYSFERLKKVLAIKSIDDLQKPVFLGDFILPFVVGQQTKMHEDIEAKDKLAATIKFLEDIREKLRHSDVPKVGSDFIAGNLKDFFGKPKTKVIQEDYKSIDTAERLVKEKWYVLNAFHGTSEEKALIEFIEDTIGNLNHTYEEVYLLKNEEVYKIYDFEKGRGFQPDFILFLKGRDSPQLSYQVFIEPKGDMFKGPDGSFKGGKEAWKEDFLKQIMKKYGQEKIIRAEHPNYRLIGLPFFNKSGNKPFEAAYNKLIKTH